MSPRTRSGCVIRLLAWSLAGTGSVLPNGGIPAGLAPIWTATGARVTYSLVAQGGTDITGRPKMAGPGSEKHSRISVLYAIQIGGKRGFESEPDRVLKF